MQNEAKSLSARVKETPKNDGYKMDVKNLSNETGCSLFICFGLWEAKVLDLLASPNS
jgi:hypothetical protein